MKNFIKFIIPEIRLNEFKLMSLHEKLYILVVFLSGFYMLLIMPILFFIVRLDLITIMSLLYYLIGFPLIIASGIELSISAKNWITKPWFKILFAACTFIVYKYSAFYTDHFLNEYTGLDPSALPKASNILITLYLPYVWLNTCAYVLLGLAFMYALIDLIDAIKRKNPKIGDGGPKVFGLFFLVVLAAYVSDIFKDNNSFYSDAIKKAIIRSSYFEKTQCNNVGEKELVADIGRGYISIYNKQTKKFRIAQCNLRLQQENHLALKP